MRNQIRILDKKTINQIAAGEVIERPASVVKELLENSLDANSTKITVELMSAGRKLIRVTDNGDGIAPDDMKIAFEKHSTNKISIINDIYNLHTFGFRGEALASIAAVALVECISSDGKSVTGNRLILEGGAVRGFSEIGCSKGTTIKVKDLFFNLPARNKYLKSDQTELAHIVDIITHLAICHYKIGFRLIHNGKELLNFPATKTQINNLVNIYGKELVRNLVPITDETLTFTHSVKDQDEVHSQMMQKVPEIRLSGYIGKPSETRSDTTNQSLFVNNRYVENKTIGNAIKDAYRTLVMKNRYPFAILFITIDPSTIDVNISPTKMHIRFEDEDGIYKLVHNKLQNTLRDNDLITEAKFTQKPQPVSLKAITTFGIGKPGFKAQQTMPSVGNNDLSGNRNEINMNKFQIKQSLLKTELEQRFDKNGLGDASSKIPIHPESTLPMIIPIGQILSTYILAQAEQNLLIIDQHAAHERIMYERIKHRYQASSMSTQELLEPVALELSPKEVGLLKSNIDTLKDLNFVIDELGDNSFYVKGIPIILGQLQEPEIIHDIINDLISLTKEKESDIIKDKMIQVMACKAAIKAGKILNMPEIQQLVRELYSIKNPYTCAHGRPTIISMTEVQLKKLFKRIV
jgi:DNA mismatch repair protein MutL